MSKTQTQSETTRTDPELTRRSLMRRTAAGTVAAGGIGAASTQAPPSLNPVQRGEALGAVGGFLIGAGVVLAGVAAAEYVKGGNSDPEGKEVADATTAEILYTTCKTIKNGQKKVRDQYDDLHNNVPQDQTPLSEAIWTEAEAAMLDAYAGNAESTIDAELLAKQVVDRRCAIAKYNVIQTWNEALVGSQYRKGFIGSVLLDYDEGTRLIRDEDAALEPNAVNESGWKGVESTARGGTNTNDKQKYMMAKTTVSASSSFAGDISSVDAVPDEFEIFALCGGLKGWFTPFDYMNSPANMTYSFAGGTPNTEQIDNIIDTSVYASYYQEIDNIKSNLKSDVTEYITTLKNNIDKQDSDWAKAVRPSTIRDEYSEANQQSKAAAELAIAGYNVPEDLSTFQVKISHPDAPSNYDWGNLFIKYADGVTAPNLTPGTEIPAADFTSAIFQYQDDNGKVQRATLADTDPIIIEDTTGASEKRQEDVRTPEGLEAGANGRVVVFDKTGDSEAPEPLQYPESHTSWKIQINGDINQYNAPLSEVKEDESEYYLSSTSLEQGETIEGIRLTSGSGYTQPIDRIKDPSSGINKEYINKRLESIANLTDQIEELDDSGGIGGGGLFNFGSNFPTIPGLGVGGTIVALFLGLFGLGQLSGN